MKKKLAIFEAAARLIAEEDEKELLLSDSLDTAVDKFLMSNERKTTVSDDKNEDDNSNDDAGDDTKPDKTLNTEHYAKAVARLMKHYDDLIDVPNTIMRRALNYVTQNHDEETSNKVKKILTKEYQLGPDVKDLDYDIQAPTANRAGSGNVGGGG